MYHSVIVFTFPFAYVEQNLLEGRIGLVVSALDLKPGDPGSSLGVAHETNA
jgi:hypothetical protein